VKGSKFIGGLYPVDSEEEVATRLQAIRKKYFDATHNCYAWRLYPELEKSSDDGEPSGSAGKPILQVLSGAGLHNALVVVTRYFGGTKLGVGGLVRAYGDAARAAIEDAPIRRLISVTRATIAVTFDEMSKLYHVVDRAAGVRIEAEQYTDTGPVFSLRIASEGMISLTDLLRDTLNREPRWTILEERLDQI